MSHFLLLPLFLNGVPAILAAELGKGPIPSSSGLHDLRPTMQGPKKPFLVPDGAYVENTTGRETVAGWRDAGGRVANAVPIARRNGVLPAFNAGGAEADPMGAGRAPRSPSFRRAIMAISGLAPVPGPIQVAHDAVQPRPYVATHPSNAVGGPRNPPETITDVLVPIVEVP